MEIFILFLQIVLPFSFLGAICAPLIEAIFRDSKKKSQCKNDCENWKSISNKIKDNAKGASRGENDSQ